MGRKAPRESEAPLRDERLDDNEDVRSAVRRAARALADRYDTLAPEVAEDPEFRAAVALLESSELTPKEIAGLANENSPYLAAIALRALMERGTAPRAWERRVVRRHGA